MTEPAEKSHLKVLLCSPRGFCAGVVRAIESVERALAIYGPPVYVRHEIVHNRYVVDGLRAKGAVFVEELDEVPDTGAPVIFSAHGVPKSVPDEAGRRNLFNVHSTCPLVSEAHRGANAVPDEAGRLNLFTLDATCPLVTKVHREAEIHYRRGREIVLIGHAGHPEVIGTMGQLPPGAVTLIENLADADNFTPRDPDKLAYVTQTTLSVADAAAIVERLKARFPNVVAPHKEDICYATTNRQEVVKRVAPIVDAMIVVGSPNSSNSQRLKEVAERAGCPYAVLVQRAADIDWKKFGKIARLGITAAASAPEGLVEEIIGVFAEKFTVSLETVSAAEEGVFFPLPRPLREPQTAD